MAIWSSSFGLPDTYTRLRIPTFVMAIQSSIFNFLFLGGPAPVVPFPDCGTSDLEADEELGCETPPNCE